MKKALLLLVSVAIAATSFAQNKQSEDLTRAIQPLVDGIPQISVVRLRALLAGQLTAEDRRLATAKLGQALVASNRPEEALTVLDNAELRDLPATKFFQAQALAAQQRWAEALPLYQRAIADPSTEFHNAALIGAGEALRSLGQIEEALRTFALLSNDLEWGTRARLRAAELLITKNELDEAGRALNAIAAKSAAERKERRFLRGCLESRLGHRQKAIDLFAWILKHPEGAAHPVLVASLFAIAEEHLNAGRPNVGDDFLEDFIEHYPEDETLPEIFAKLDQLYSAERKQSRHDLGRWSRDTVQPRRALAQWYLARAELRLGQRDGAFQAFEQLRQQHPNLPALAGAFLEYAQLQIGEGQFEDAIAVLEKAGELHPRAELMVRIDSMIGHAQFAARRFDKAAESFRRIAQTALAHRNDALFNVSLAWLEGGDEKQFEAAAQDLSKGTDNLETRGDLILEKGLIEASRGEKTATGSLQNFIRDFPKHPRVSEAWVALAELAFHAAPPRLEEARQDLARAADRPTPAAQERSDYFIIWLEESAEKPDESKLVELETQFLQKYPSSAFAADVRLKLAETYYRRQDFASAQTQFTLLGQQNPNSPLVEKAQFFAAQSAMQSMSAGSVEKALVMFDQVVKKNGELKWAARNEQAVIERKLGKPDDAITLYDEVLKGDGKAAEKREALCGKGDILYDLGPTDPENYKRAMEIYGQLAAQTDPATHWHNQALFKKGMCLEKLNSPAEALTTFYEIIEDGSRPDRRREFFWFYKAGFNAGRLLEEQSDWKPAAAIYEKLAFAGGARSEEAKSRLNRIRLEHFLWD